MAASLQQLRAAGPRPFTAGAVAPRPRVVAVSATEKAYHPSPLSQAPPSTYAVVEIGGKQMFVEPGKWYTCNRLKAEVGSRIKFGRVLAVKHEGKLEVGMPYLEKVNVEAEVIEELRGPKIIVYKMKPKKHYRRKQGHRWGVQPWEHAWDLGPPMWPRRPLLRLPSSTTQCSQCYCLDYLSCLSIGFLRAHTLRRQDLSKFRVTKVDA